MVDIICSCTFRRGPEDELAKAEVSGREFRLAAAPAPAPAQPRPPPTAAPLSQRRRNAQKSALVRAS